MHTIQPVSLVRPRINRIKRIKSRMCKFYLSFILSGTVRILFNCLSSISIVLLILTVAACGSDKVERMKIPGNPKLNDYGITFKIDRSVFESGTYVYSPGDRRKHGMGGGRFGYLDFYPLILDFKFKDGRKFYEEVDLKPLIQEMVKNHKIFDLKTTKWGGFAKIIIRVESDSIKMDYELVEMIKKESLPMMRYKRYYYPLFVKILK